MNTIDYLQNLPTDFNPYEDVTAIPIGMLVPIIIVGLVAVILTIIGWWKVFEKAGEKGWKSLIPIYNLYISFKICKMTTWFWYYITISIVSAILCAIDGFILYQTDLSKFDLGVHPTTAVALGTLCIVAIIIYCVYAYKMSKVFGKGTLFMVGMFFIPEIMILILGFGNAKYDKKNLKRN